MPRKPRAHAAEACSKHDPHSSTHDHPCGKHPYRRFAPFAIVLGILSLGWLILRTGRKPDRLSYPCQQAALGHVALLLGLPIAHYLRKAFSQERDLRAGVVAVMLAVVAVFTAVGLSDLTPADLLAFTNRTAPAPTAAPRADYETTVYVVHGAGGPSGSHHLGVDELISTMAAGGLPFYESAIGGGEAGPNGVVGANDLVLVKINQQWSERGGTNTDVLRGLIARILEHPDGFAGEIVVVENTQGSGTFDWGQANAEDHSQSAQDVVNAFAVLGNPVSTYLWDTIRTTSVGEYSAGDLQDGYVIGPYLTDTQIRVSYPKFETPEGAYVSLAHGIWDDSAGTYDDSNVTFINVPVLKCHGAVYGVTACTKNHVGTMTTTLATSTHSAVRYGGLGSFLADVRMADLNILDAIYILARPNGGPWCFYTDATRVDKLMASKDPVALDIWATTNVLVPTILDNGYSSYPKQDPEDPGSIFRIYLDATMNELLEAGIDATNDLSQIQVVSNDAVDANPNVAWPVGNAGAYPNPFLTKTSIRFDAVVGGEARVDLFDVTGRRVRSLRQSVAAGEAREIDWNGFDEAGRRLPAGTYYWRLSGTGEPLSGKVTLLR